MIEEFAIYGIVILIKSFNFPPIAQSVEQLPFKEMVPGSNPGGRIMK